MKNNMNRPFEVVQVGLGPMGQIIANLMLDRQNINLKGVVEIRSEFIGKNLHEILGNELGSGVNVFSDLEGLLKKENIDVVFIATSSSLKNVAPIIKQAINANCNVISICEELSYPYIKYERLSKELDELAKKYEKTIIGTGINPGYLMDLLPIVLTAPCQKVNSIKVKRLMNSSKRREPFQRKIGTGLSPEEFQDKISNKEITGHVGLKESMYMIINALGLNYDEVIEFPPEPILTNKDFTTSYGVKVRKGDVCGLKSKAITYLNGKEIIILDFIAYAGEHEEYDSVVIDGVPSIHQKIIGGVHGDLGTAAMVVNLIPRVIDAKPGLLTMKDIPVPCNTENIWKD